MIVTFCGHSQTSNQDNVAGWLDIILPALIAGGANTFYLGGYGDFDRLVAAAVRRQKAVYPHIESILVLPYLNRKFDVSAYDSTTYPPLENVPPRYAITKRNQWMVCESDVVISGVTHSWGGAAKTLDCARRREKSFFSFQPLYPCTNSPASMLRSNQIVGGNYHADLCKSAGGISRLPGGR